MTRYDELMAEYPKGYVTEPGKFEGESIATVYFYGLMLDGVADEVLDDNGTTIDVFTVTPGECRLWSLPTGTTRVGVWSNDAGFTFLSKWTDAEYEHALAELACRRDDESGELQSYLADGC